MVRSVHVVVAAALLASSTPEPARADALHVYGPPGTAGERRAIAVPEDATGACVPAEAVTLTSNDPGVTVTRLEAAGACARWIQIGAAPARQTVLLEARAETATASADVELGATVALEVAATRRGS